MTRKHMKKMTMMMRMKKLRLIGEDAVNAMLIEN